jgi:chitin deacetylase
MTRVALSFDDGPGPSTAALLDVLFARKVRATFFLLGKNVLRSPDVVRRMLRDGHVLGNHSFSHPRPEAVTEKQMIEEIERTDAILADLYREAGAAPPSPIPVRLPYGPAKDDPRVRALERLGRAHIHWTADFGDWENPPAEDIVKGMRGHIERQRASGQDAVIDLHDSSRLFAERAETVEAVRLLLEDAALTFFTVPE